MDTVFDRANLQATERLLLEHEVARRYFSGEHITEAIKYFSPWFLRMHKGESWNLTGL